MKEQDDIAQKLMDRGVRPSPQRIAIMEYLTQHRTHPTVDEIYEALCPSLPTLSKTTVYNTLDLLERNGLVHAILIDERNARFDGWLEPHAHFKCIQCGTIYDIEDCTVTAPAMKDMEVSGTEISFFGKCKNCLTHNQYSNNN